MPPTAPGGICPECMLKAGLAIQTEGPGGTGPHGTKVVHPPPTPAEIASLFPQLEILECLGRGGMGVVYKARQPRLNRLVALKILARDKEQDARFTERFTREAQALARLNHPNIVTVHDFGEAGGHCYLVMEFVDGLNLRQLLQTGKMKPEQALTIVPKICEALQYAHEQGIVHRDIKPENILLDKSGRVKIADFGIAKILGDEAGQQTLTGAKDAVGTPHYMAPEQIEKPQTVDHRADIYSLGVVFYEMLTGELPLGKFQPPSKKVQVDVRLDEVVLHALEKDPERRYQHASEVKTQVETIVATSTGDRSPKVDESVRRALRTPARGLIAAGVLQLLFSLGLLAFGIVVAREDGDVVAYAGIGFVAVLFMAFAAIVLRGAAGMMKLRNYPFSVVTSVVAAVTGPGALLGLPFGVWALVELIRPEVRAAFAANRPPSGSNATLAPGKMDFARSQVKGPAIGLVVTGVLDWVLMALVCIIVGLKSAGGLPIWLPFLAMALSSCIIYAGLKFMQLERRGVVIFGSVLALLVSPGNLIGLPLGIWALVALNRREVREAFEANRQRADKTNLSVPPTAQRADHFWRFIVIVFLVIPTLGLLSSIALKNYIKTGGNPQPPIKYDYIGQAWFPQGDSIAITSVERTEKQMTVKGHYNLVSHDSATLALYVTSTNQSGFSEDAQQSMQISKGPGDFELSDFHLVPGLPHVSMYADGKPFAGLYFGTKAEALEESAAGWITNAAPAAGASSVEPSDLREARAKLAELRVDYSGQNHAVQEALARVKELEQMTKEEPNALADLREAKAHLAELRVDYSDQNHAVQEALARVKELEQMTKEEPNASAELREVKAHLAELRVDYTEQNPRIQEALARIKVLEQNRVAPVETSPTLAEQPPVVVETQPVSGVRDVDPGVAEIRVRFSKEMADGSWSWSTAWENSTPESIGEPRYESDHRTCVLKVKLEPGRTYAWWLNSNKFKNFTDLAGRPAVPYLLIFQTKPN